MGAVANKHTQTIMNIETEFEVCVFNEDVRRAVENQERHPNFDDAWADLNYIEVLAEDEADARRKIERRYPERRGFRITGVFPLRIME